MRPKPKERIRYGEANYKSMVLDNAYYVDKTAYIRLMEEYKNPVFLRPRRFGKSLWCTTLKYYYDINEAGDFELLFGHTDIGKEPTPLHNRFIVLSLDFSIIEPYGDIEQIRHRFNRQINTALQVVLWKYKKYFKDFDTINEDEDASTNLAKILGQIEAFELPKLFIIIDEYDNFANQLITAHKDALYRELTADNSFLKNFFKTMKNGCKARTIDRVFITGVLPITIDDLSSGYNIADFLTLERAFENMMGFTQKETESLLDMIYSDNDIDPATRPLIMETITANYNGYRIIDPKGEGLFNSTILMYFLRKFINYNKIPHSLIDVNLKTDVSWVKRLTASNPDNTKELVNQLLIHNRLSYNKTALSEKFNMSQFFQKDFYPISFFYLGMLTKQDDRYMCLPNLNMRSIFVDYFNDIYNIDVSTKYAELMAGFVNQPDIPTLFTGYWELYISQLPEAIFQQVNENFYRTTFFELCRQHLSDYFTFEVERSYVAGRTDLEFIGKFHTQFAGHRYLLEFKYYSNKKWEKISKDLDGDIAQFQPPEKDINQLKAYEKEWKKEHPRGVKKSFLVYCIGNQWFRVFPI
ncbi:MAG: AAA family ATPase [bacterium]|nr:AAA family ATPase [bacterium]